MTHEPFDKFKHGKIPMLRESFSLALAASRFGLAFSPSTHHTAP